MQYILHYIYIYVIYIYPYMFCSACTYMRLMSSFSKDIVGSTIGNLPSPRVVFPFGNTALGGFFSGTTTTKTVSLAIVLHLQCQIWKSLRWASMFSFLLNPLNKDMLLMGATSANPVIDGSFKPRHFTWLSPLWAWWDNCNRYRPSKNNFMLW